MKRRLPISLESLVEGYKWRRDTIGESGATIHRLKAKGRPGLYLKQGRNRVASDIVDEFARLVWLGPHCPVPTVRHFGVAEDAAWLLTDAVPGVSAYRWLGDNPGRQEAAIAGMADFLRALHALPVQDCPFDASLSVRMAAARRNVDAGIVDCDDFDEARAGWSAEQVWQRLVELAPATGTSVVTHGDFSLDNIFIDDAGVVVGIIDVGRAGLADPYQDLAILSYCLGEFDPALPGLLFDAYGVAADTDRIDLHLCLDELF